FPNRRIFPVQFLLRHYPIRGQKHGMKKVFEERKPRFLENEKSRGWHRQYDEITGESHSFLKDPRTLMPFALDSLRLELMGYRDTQRNLEDPHDRTDAELVELKKRHVEMTRHAANLEVERNEVRKHASNLEVERNEVRKHASNLEVERGEISKHATN